MLLRIVFVSSLLLGACGKDKSDGGGASGGGAAGGPSCSEAATAFFNAHLNGAGNKITPGIKPPPTPEETKTLIAAFEADCNTRPWSAKEKTCVMAIKDLLTEKSCFKGLMVSQMVHDSAEAVKAARAAGGGAAAGSAAAAGSGAAAGSAAAGSGSAAP